MKAVRLVCLTVLLIGEVHTMPSLARGMLFAGTCQPWNMPSGTSKFTEENRDFSFVGRESYSASIMKPIDGVMHYEHYEKPADTDRWALAVM